MRTAEKIIKLLSSNPDKPYSVEEIAAEINTEVAVTAANCAYVMVFAPEMRRFRDGRYVWRGLE